ncbi:MAG: Ig-like domain repeat protein [Chloroflexi bacterium]|nr:Ig-like domain repeat protein [Chloroflexota bacterium]
MMFLQRSVKHGKQPRHKLTGLVPAGAAALARLAVLALLLTLGLAPVSAAPAGPDFPTGPLANIATTTTFSTPSPASPATNCQPVSFLVSVTRNDTTGAVISGTVSFTDNSTAISGCQNLALNGSGQATCNVSALTISGSPHTIAANYSGAPAGPDTLQASSNSINYTVNKATTTITVVGAPNASTYTQKVTFTATVTSACGNVTGVVFFNDNGTTIGTGAVNPATGIATLDTTELDAGTHKITVVYGGDEDHSASDNYASPYSQVVNKATTTVAVTSSANPSVWGQPVTFQATVSTGASAVPSGAVIFKADGIYIGQANLNGSAQASFTTAALEVANHPITAEYEGDLNFSGNTGNLSGGQTVNKADTTTTVTSDKTPTVYGEQITFFITISPVPPGAGAPGGNVLIKVDGNDLVTVPVGLVGTGKAQFQTSPLGPIPASASDHNITAFYQGDSHFNTSDNSATPYKQHVNKANTATQVINGLTTSTVGQPVSILAQVTPVAPGFGTPSGMVEFRDNGNLVATVPLVNGQVSQDITFSTPGTHVVNASYLGDANFNTSNANQAPDQTVTKADTTATLTSSGNPSFVGQLITFTVQVTISGSSAVAFVPGGTVAFNDNGIPITGCGSVPLVGGTAQCATSTLTAGAHPVKVVYGGDANFNGTTSNQVTQNVNKGNTTTTVSSVPPGSAVLGAPVTFTAVVAPSSGTGVPSGNVKFLDGGSPIAGCTAQPLAAGLATCVISTLGAGNHAITAQYLGDTSYNTSVSNPPYQFSITAAGSATALVGSANPTTYGQTVYFTATVTTGSGTPTGLVTFKDGAATVGSGILDGTGNAYFSTNALTVGLHPISAVYGGDNNFAGSTSNTINQQVNQASTTTTIANSPSTSVFGQAVLLTATVTINPPGLGTPTGPVTFTVGATVLGVVNLNAFGKAFLTTSTIPVGLNQTVTASFGGTANLAASNGTTLQTVNAASTTTTVVANPNPSLPGLVVTYTATVAPVAPGGGTPVGTVNFTEGGSLSGCGAVPLVAGVATCSTTYGAAGSHTITATYTPGNGNHNGSNGQVIEDVSDTPADLSVSVTDAPDPVLAGQNVTYTIQVVNTGPGQNVTLVNTLPAGGTFVSISAGAWSCTTPAVGSGGVVQCTRSPLGTNASESIVVVVNVPLSTPAGSIFTDQVQVSGNRPDTDPSNNTALAETTVYRSPRGDCNADGAVNRGDIFSIVAKIFDTSVLTPVPSPSACDSNQDRLLDAGDLPCTALIMFNGPVACSAANQTRVPDALSLFMGTALAGPALSLPQQLTPHGNGQVAAPVSFTGNGKQISAVVFAVDYDAQQVSFDGADLDHNGIPDAISLNVPGDFIVSVETDLAHHRLNISVADISSPLRVLADGALLTIGFQSLNANPAGAAIPVAFSQQPRASFGDTAGHSVLGQATPARMHQLYLPFARR